MMAQPITEDQKQQYKRFVEDTTKRTLRESDIEKDGVQKLMERGDEFQAHIIAGIQEFSMSNQFAYEEVESSYRYLSGYKPKNITEQTNCLRELFPGIGCADEKLAEQPLPPNAEGWFAIPRWDRIAHTYNEAVDKVLAMISKTRNGEFYNYRDGKLGPNRLRQHERTVAMLRKLGDQQTGHDILVAPAQFGICHRGRSVRRAREVFKASEFGLGAFAVGIMLLTYPDRLMNYDDLWIDCAGDEYAPSADGQYVSAPCFLFRGSKVWFDTFWFDHASRRYGSASGFVTQ
jgi:hypothetical protein